MELMSATGQSILEDFSPANAPHTISYALIYRARINSFFELPKDKRPPKNLWDKPHRLSIFFEEIFKAPSKDGSEGHEFVEFNNEDVE